MNVQSIPPDESSVSGDRVPHRRAWMRTMTCCAGLPWLTPLSHLLADESPSAARAKGPPRSLIVLWLAGGPSQLETFDPHAGTSIAGGTRDVETSVRGVRFARDLQATAEHMEVMTIVRNVVSKEGDHERATYYAKTGYRPIPAVTHPSIGAIACHQLQGFNTDLPHHISILTQEWPSRGGYLGNEFDPFLIGDPQDPIPDVRSPVDPSRFKSRWADLRQMEADYAQVFSRRANLPFANHADHMSRAAAMMTSEQLRALDVTTASLADRARFGDTAFGRGCLVAGRLTEVGVRCVEVTLSGWDSHVNNHETHGRLGRVLDQALAGLLATLREQHRLRDTLVMIGGEFGRTPLINRAGGRDHWPHGFSIALAGGALRPGVVIGATDPRGERVAYDSGTTVADLHATILAALGIDPALEIPTPLGRPMKLSDGRPVPFLLGT